MSTRPRIAHTPTAALAVALLIAVTNGCGSDSSVSLSIPAGSRTPVAASPTRPPATATASPIPTRTATAPPTDTAPVTTSTTTLPPSRTSTETAIPTRTSTDTPAPTRTSTETSVPTRTSTHTPVPTTTIAAPTTTASASPTISATPQPPTATATRSASPTPTNTVPATNTAPPTASGIPTETAVATATATTAMSPAATHTFTATALPSETFTPIATPTMGGGATCGDRLLEQDETCDSCPADCAVGPCNAPGDPTQAYVVDLIPPLGFQPTTATVLLAYDSTKLSLPDTGTAIDVRRRVVSAPPVPQAFTPNDLDYAVRVLESRNTPLGTLFTATFDRCAGAPAPTLADVACTVSSCAAGGTGVPGCTCTVRLP